MFTEFSSSFITPGGKNNKEEKRVRKRMQKKKGSKKDRKQSRGEKCAAVTNSDMSQQQGKQIFTFAKSIKMYSSKLVRALFTSRLGYTNSFTSLTWKVHKKSAVPKCCT